MIRDSYNGLRADLERSLDAATDVKDAADALGRTLDKLRMDTRLSSDNALMSRETDRLFDAARQASRMMLSVTEADVTARPAAMTKRDKIKKALPWLGAGLGLLLTAWMELLGQHAGAFVALISAACSLGQLWLKTDGAQGEYQARKKLAAETRRTFTAPEAPPAPHFDLGAADDDEGVPYASFEPPTGEGTFDEELLRRFEDDRIFAGLYDKDGKRKR